MSDNILAQEAASVETEHLSPRGIRKGLYLLPSAFTAANIGMGYYAVMGALRGFQLLYSGSEGELARATTHFDNAARAIGWAILFDALDGRIARMTKTTTEIGVQFDSIADVLTFGIAPAVLVYAWGYGSTFAEGSPFQKLGWFFSFMFLICGAFRLARFNVQAMRPRTLAEGSAKLDKKHFVGLPIPAAAGLIAALVHFAPVPLSHYQGEQPTIYSGLIMALMAILSTLMVSTLRFTSFKNIGSGKRSTMKIIIIIAACGMFIWLFSRYVLLFLISVYIMHGIISRIWSFTRKNKNSAAGHP